MAYHFDGKAIFSTHNGEYARRETIPSIRTILRSDPIEDQHTIVAKLQQEFPEVCKAITAPVTDRDVYEYFDYCDAAVQGFEFLRAVLDYIARLNASVSAEKVAEVRDYVGRWRNTNAEAFTYTKPYHAVTDLFTKEDIEEHGVDFLTEAMVQIKRLKAQENDTAARQSAVRPQSQQPQMMQDQGNFTQSQAPARSPFPVNVSSAQGMRASSNPERGQPHPQGGLPRHFPAPQGQLPAPQFHFPLQRLTPSTEVLEHIHPGSTRRGDFHSDPVAQDAMNSYNSGPPNTFVAIPSRGLPGPFTYRPLPPSTQPVPLLSRIGTFDGNPPRGKRNPKKKSSDDARMAPGTGNGPPQASSNTNPKQNFASQHVQMRFDPRSPPFFHEVNPSSKAVPYPAGNAHHHSLPPGHRAGNWPESFRRPPYHGQAPVQPKIEGHSSERVASNPFSPSTLSLQGPAQDQRHPVPSLPRSTTTQHQIGSANEQLFEENDGLDSTHVRPHNYGRQRPDHQFHAQQEQDHVPDFQRAVLAPVSNASQLQLPATPGRSRANETPRRLVQDGCTIWIGRIPNGFDRAAVMDLLRQCRGLVDFSGPKVSSPSKMRKNNSYAFADFRHPADAAEALERLPQTRFPSLPQGIFLVTAYAKSKVYSSPSHYNCGSDGASKRPVSSISPSKSRKDEGINNVGNSHHEHSRKTSKCSTRGKKQPVSGSDGKPGKPLERVMAADADKEESNLQPEEAILCPGPDGKPGSTPHESRSTTDGLDPMPINQDPGAIQSDDGVGPRANQVATSASDGAQDTSPAPSAKLQVQERSSRSSRQTEGGTKASKKKSKGSNKLSLSGKGIVEPRTVHAASGNAKPKARAKSSAHETPQSLPQSLKNSTHTVEEGNQAECRVEASRMIASIIPLEYTPTSKKLETADESFLGREATEVDGGEPKASVAKVSRMKSKKTNTSETAPALLETARSSLASEQSDELTSQPMRRHLSNSTQGSVDTTWSLLSYTGPPASSQTERSSSISQDNLSPKIQAACLSMEATPLPHLLGPGRLKDEVEPSIVSSSTSQYGSAGTSKRACEEYGQPQEAKLDWEIATYNPGPGEITVQEISRPATSLVPLGMENSAKYVEELKDPIKGDSRAGLIKENPEQASNTSSIQLSSLKPDQALSKNPARKGALSIPPRSSSLPAPSTPIKTHEKKKPRKLTPVTEASSSHPTSVPADPMRTDSSLQAIGSTELNPPVLSVDPAAHTLTTDKARHLPKPETPFLMDDGERVDPPNISRQLVEASTADLYYAQKKEYQVFYWSCSPPISANFCSLDCYDSASTPLSEAGTPDSSSAEEIGDLETTLREAGYRSLTGTSPFTITDPELAFLETIDEQGKPLDNRTNKDGPVLTWLDSKGKIEQVMSLEAWTKQHEMMEVVKKATAAKRLLVDSSPLPWSKIESLRQKLSQFVTRVSNDTCKQHATKSQARRILKAEALVNSIPQRDASTGEMQKWSRKVSVFMDQNPSDPTAADMESTISIPSRKQQHDQRYPVLINQPESPFLAHELRRDDNAAEAASTNLNGSHTSGQTTESEPSPSTYGRQSLPEEELTPSLTVMPPTALPSVTRLKHVFEIEEDRQHWSDDRHWSSIPQWGEHMTGSDPEHQSLGGELAVSRLTQVKRVNSEQGIYKTENETQQDTYTDKSCKSKGDELCSDEMKQDQRLTNDSDKSKDPTSAELDQRVVQESEGPAHRKQNSQLPQVSFSSFESNRTNNEGISDESQQTRPRDGHSPLKRGGYNTVAGRGIAGERKAKEAGKDPWALPQGEKAWGSGAEGRGKPRKREG